MSEKNDSEPPTDQQWQFRPDDTTVSSNDPGQTGINSPQVSLPEQYSVNGPNSILPQVLAVPPRGSDGSISWTASEFIAHHKTTQWYVILGVVAIIAAALVWLLTKDKISAASVVIAAAAFGFYANRQPRQLEYRLDQQSLGIGSRHFSYEEFRSFGIRSEGAFSSITFLPLKRFATLTTIYYAPQDEPKIIDILSSHIPREDRDPDMVEKLMSRIRF